MKYDVSIIVPMFNAEKYLSEFLNSIFKQNTEYNYQLIIVDDGSTDHSSDIVKSFKIKHKNIILLSQKNKKQAAARNFGLEYAEGKYLLFLDCDDIVKHNMIQNMVQHAEQGADLVMCGIIKKFPNYEVIENKTTIICDSKDELVNNYLTKNREIDVGLWNKLFRTDIVRKNNLQFENKNFFEDSLFNLKYLSLCNPKKIYFDSTPYYILFKHGDSTTTTYNAEIDALATNYIELVVSYLESLELVLDTNVEKAFRIRLLIHCLHHHIKYDEKFSFEKQYKENVKKLYSPKVIKKLSLKYRISFFMIRYCFSIYRYIYKRRSI